MSVVETTFDIRYYDDRGRVHSPDANTPAWITKEAPAWAASTAYAQGAQVQTTPSVSHPFPMIFTCTVTGTSGATAPVWAWVSASQPVTDGTVTWEFLRFASGQFYTEGQMGRSDGPSLRKTVFDFLEATVDANGITGVITHPVVHIETWMLHDQISRDADNAAVVYYDAAGVPIESLSQFWLEGERLDTQKLWGLLH
jgi:hypothetical protein